LQKALNRAAETPAQKNQRFLAQKQEWLISEPQRYGSKQSID